MKLVVFFIFMTLFVSGSAFSKQTDENKGTKNISENKDPKPAEIKWEPAPLPTHDMGSDWIPVRTADDVSTYKLAKNSKVIGTFHLQKQDKKFGKAFESKNFFKQFVERKQEWLFMINIREWNADRHTLKKRKDFMELNVNGSYKQPDGKQIFFREAQLFFVDSDEMYQILVISPEKKFLRTRSVRRFFKKAKEISRTLKTSKQAHTLDKKEGK